MDMAIETTPVHTINTGFVDSVGSYYQSQEVATPLAADVRSKTTYRLVDALVQLGCAIYRRRITLSLLTSTRL